jgi:hypothetical protein
MKESTMKLEILTHRGAATLLISAALAAATLAPAYAADTPCAAKPADSAGAPAQGSAAAANQKPVPDGFGREVVPGYGTTKPGTPSELAAEKKKGDQTANAGDAASSTNCK